LIRSAAELYTQSFTDDRWRQHRPLKFGNTAGMAKRPEPPKPTTWTIYKIAAKAVRLGTVEAADEAGAMEKGAAEFGVAAKRLIALRRRSPRIKT
jgi:hypothetical protein